MATTRHRRSRPGRQRRRRASCSSRGEQVRVVTRSGSGIDGVERVAADAADAAPLARAHRRRRRDLQLRQPAVPPWAQDWPPIAAALLAAAEPSGAVLATTATCTATAGGRADDRADAARRHRHEGPGAQRDVARRAGRPRGRPGARVRGPRQRLPGRQLAAVDRRRCRRWRKGRARTACPAISTCRTPGPTCATSRHCSSPASATSGRGAGPWHVPERRPLDACASWPRSRPRQLGVPAKLRALPYAAVWVGGLVNPFVKELRETQHQFRRPFVLDSTRGPADVRARPAPDRGLGALRHRERQAGDLSRLPWPDAGISRTAGSRCGCA